MFAVNRKRTLGYCGKKAHTEEILYQKALFVLTLLKHVFEVERRLETAIK